MTEITLLAVASYLLGQAFTGLLTLRRSERWEVKSLS